MNNYPDWVNSNPNDPSYPWNQKDADEKEVDVAVSITLSKSDTVGTTNYNVTTWKDEEWEDGHKIVTGGEEYEYYNLEEDYNKQHYSIPKLLEQLAIFLEEKIKDYKHWPVITAGDRAANKATLNIYKQMLEDCKDWCIDELTVIEE